MSRTHYEVLEISTGATAEEVRAAFQRLAKIHHPDRSDDPSSTDKFIEIKTAYEVLSDARRRSDYDRLIAPPKPAPKMEPQPWEVNAPTRRPAAAKRPAAKPSRDVPEMLRMTALLSQGRLANAEQYARKLIRSHPDHPLAYGVMGDIHRHRGDLAQAVEMYAIAIQLDGKNTALRSKHDQALDALSRKQKQQAYRYGHPAGPTAEPAILPVAIGVALVSTVYIFVSREMPFAPGIGPISTWTVGLVVMVIIAGIALGAGLVMAGELEPFGMNRGGDVTRVPPAVLIGLVAMVNFWAAILLYAAIGAVQKSLNTSVSRALASAGGVCLLFTFASFASHRIDGWQTLIWSGNLAYAGVVFGWLVADGVTS